MNYTFLSENYVWIIVVAVIVVMTIIGYIADKTNFGEKKSKKETKVDETNNNILNENVSVNQNVELNEDFNNYQNIESFDMPVLEQNNEEMASLEPQMMETVQSEVFEPVQSEIIEEVQPEMTEAVQPEIVEPFQTETSLDDFEMPEEEVVNYLQDNIYNQDITVEENNNYENDEVVSNFEENNFQTVEQSKIIENQQPEEFTNEEFGVSEENTQEVQPVQPQEIDFELPSIDKLNEEIAEVEEDEDVWKF